MKRIITAATLAAVLGLVVPVTLTGNENEEKEQSVQMADLPGAVQKTIKDKAGSNEILRVEKENEHGKMTYEAVIKKNGKEWGLAVDENGKYLGKHEESREHKETDEEAEKY